MLLKLLLEKGILVKMSCQEVFNIFLIQSVLLLSGTENAACLEMNFGIHMHVSCSRSQQSTIFERKIVQRMVHLNWTLFQVSFRFVLVFLKSF